LPRVWHAAAVFVRKYAAPVVRRTIYYHASRSHGAEKEFPPMLVLSRQRDESIIIGDEIKITIVDIRGDKVRLGIEAPTAIPVHRQEVYEAIQRENRRSEAGEAPPADAPPAGRPRPRTNRESEAAP
jgi:carbon storage regulator